MLKRVVFAAASLTLALSVHAKVDEGQAQRLGQDLTPLGGEKAGNADGSIPAWDGGIATPPAGYNAGDHHPDPYAADAPLFEVDAAGLAAHAARVPLGLQQLLKDNPQYKMRVYPTRRSASAPQRIYDATRYNATQGELIANGNGVQGVASGVPFPIPQDGLEVIWNHIMRYRGESFEMNTNMAAVLPNGDFNLQRQERFAYFFYGREGMTPADLDNTLFYYKYRITAPAKIAGSALVVQEPMDQVLAIRKAWRYDVGQRRVRRLPKLAYDSLQPDTNGIGLADTVDVYNGAPDKYEWTLLGKQEMLVPYNSYKVHQKGLKYDDIVQRNHVNDSLLRYELHRVWVVEAALRAGHSHVHGKRRFYLDEDSWQILAVDLYDEDGQKLVGAQEVHPINYYEVPLVTSTLEVTYDFKGQRFLVDGLDNNEKMYNFNADLTPRDFTSSALRREGR
ncbi:DUF1329 domain-containing protein [Atopomonas sediminilitoris]|uniref:DUF1329 domain-containing protein n=1 Tax=Atopomonas sediminilitoris TaxID=2919919 RepID=UPI001F4F0ADA|nr:DUF1329 domain-containing protein [Atopomonas sediminilitoris]